MLSKYSPPNAYVCDVTLAVIIQTLWCQTAPCFAIVTLLVNQKYDTLLDTASVIGVLCIVILHS